LPVSDEPALSRARKGWPVPWALRRDHADRSHRDPSSSPSVAVRSGYAQSQGVRSQL